jgi:serine/threonine protein kinase
VTVLAVTPPSDSPFSFPTGLVPTTTRFRPLAPIGRGGMAEVMLALMDAGGGANRIVVLKRIWPDLATDPDFVAMFNNEAQLAVRLNHPNVVQTLEVVQDPAQLALAMEYLHGQSLAGLLNRLAGPRGLPLPLRLRVLVEILAGLHYAHELTDYNGTPLGVVHRDVSPDNVFVTYDGQVKLMDFGVAKSTAAASRTRPGAVKGKLAYLAPEYFRSEIVDRRADVFAVGVMLWEMLAGRRLWAGLGEAQIVHHLAAGMPMARLPPDDSRPPLLDGICARALAVSPGDRYATAAELELDLQGVLAGTEDSHARTLGRVVSNAFQAVRAEREALIARALETGSGPLPLAGPSWAREIDAMLPTIDGFFELTVVDVDVSFADEAKPPPPPPPPRLRRRPLRSAIATTLLGGAVAFALFAELGQSRAPSPPAAPRPTAVAAAPSVPPATTPAPPVAPIPSPPPAPEPTSATTVDTPPTDHSDYTAALRMAVEAPANRKAHPERRTAAAKRVSEDAPEGRGREARPERAGEASPDRPRPAPVRGIDESDPFK